MVMIFLVNREVWKNSYSSGVIYLASDLLLLSKKEPGLETTGEIITWPWVIQYVAVSAVMLKKIKERQEI